MFIQRTHLIDPKRSNAIFPWFDWRKHISREFAAPEPGADPQPVHVVPPHLRRVQLPTTTKPRRGAISQASWGSRTHFKPILKAMFHFPLNRCKRLQGCCWRARCSTCPSSSTPPSPPRAPRPRPQLCERRRKNCRLLSSSGNDCHRVKTPLPTDHNSLKTCLTTSWKPVENKLPTQPVENLLKLPTNQLKTIWASWKLETANVVCWKCVDGPERGKLVEREAGRLKPLKIQLKPTKTTSAENSAAITQEWVLTSPKAKSLFFTSGVILSWCYLSIDRSRESEKEICRKKKKLVYRKSSKRKKKRRIAFLRISRLENESGLCSLKALLWK